jgi:hypothetical protein
VRLGAADRSRTDGFQPPTNGGTRSSRPISILKISWEGMLVVAAGKI